ARITRSAPRPSVRAFTSATTSVCRGSHDSEAPHFRESSSRVGMVSVARTVAPFRFTSIVNISPMGPWPTTTTTSSGSGAHCSTAFTHVLTGPTKAARSNETPDGIFPTPRRTIQSITRTYWEKPPPAGSYPAVIPTFLYVGHWAYTFFRQ